MTTKQKKKIVADIKKVGKLMIMHGYTQAWLMDQSDEKLLNTHSSVMEAYREAYDRE